MTERPHVDRTARGPGHLTLDELRGRHRQAWVAEALADAPGPRRAIEGRRLWRRKRELVEEELVRRGDGP